ncbi:hypothetical protein QBC35DRAFT_390015 [Podospora australis]|uniref:C2H2-type domain-containing protein n=1 Tax=Podospora australis TaxID=1536484 RepID=A0AAN6WN96_9PEZI|nr:hypothetical protein QBC35DRAFT_390015 [Podospora australis]
MPYVHELPSPILAVPNINHKQNPAQKSRSDTIGGVKIEEEANFWEESTDIEDSSNNPRRQYRAQTPRRASRRLTTKEEASFVCEVEGCFKMFSRSHHFEAHMKTHDEKRDYPFPCTIADCNKKFVCRTDLQRHHQAAHMKERLHRCDYCARLFARKDTLRRHVEDGCSKRFDLGELNLKQDSLPEPSMGTSNSCSTEVDHVGGMQDTQLYRDHVNTPGGLFFDGGT